MGSTKLHQLLYNFELDPCHNHPWLSLLIEKMTNPSSQNWAAWLPFQGCLPCSAPGWLMPGSSTPHVTFLPATSAYWSEFNFQIQVSHVHFAEPALTSWTCGTAPTMVSITFYHSVGIVSVTLHLLVLRATTDPRLAHWKVGPVYKGPGICQTCTLEE